jgi:MFS family permease
MHLKLINAQFDKLFWGRLVSEIGHYLYHFAIGWYILDLTSSAAQTGIYLAFTGIIQVIMTPLGGVLVDRWNRVKVIYMTDFLRSGIILLAGLSITFMPIVDMGAFVLDSISIPLYFLIVTLSLLTVAILASLSRSLKSF